MGVSLVYTSPYSPNSNGEIEKLNGILKATIRRLTCEHPFELWPNLIQQACFAVRILVTKATKFSPFELLYGVTPNLPGAKKLNIDDREDHQVE